MTIRFRALPTLHLHFCTPPPPILVAARLHAALQSPVNPGSGPPPVRPGQRPRRRTGPYTLSRLELAHDRLAAPTSTVPHHRSQSLHLAKLIHARRRVRRLCRHAAGVGPTSSSCCRRCRQRHGSGLLPANPQRPETFLATHTHPASARRGKRQAASSRSWTGLDGILAAGRCEWTNPPWPSSCRVALLVFPFCLSAVDTSPCRPRPQSLTWRHV